VAEKESNTVLINDTPFSPPSHEFEFEEPKDHYRCDSLDLSQGAQEDISDKVGWTFILRKRGLVLLCDGEPVPKPNKLSYGETAKVVVEKGKEYRIVIDQKCPPMTAEELAQAYTLEVICTEHGISVPPLFKGEFHPSKLITQVHKRIS